MKNLCAMLIIRKSAGVLYTPVNFFPSQLDSLTSI